MSVSSLLATHQWNRRYSYIAPIDLKHYDPHIVMRCVWFSKMEEMEFYKHKKTILLLDILQQVRAPLSITAFAKNMWAMGRAHKRVGEAMPPFCIVIQCGNINQHSNARFVLPRLETSTAEIYIRELSRFYDNLSPGSFDP